MSGEFTNPFAQKQDEPVQPNDVSVGDREMGEIKTIAQVLEETEDKKEPLERESFVDNPDAPAQPDEQISQSDARYVQNTLRVHGNQESNIPINDRYWQVKRS